MKQAADFIVPRVFAEKDQIFSGRNCNSVSLWEYKAGELTI